MLKLRSCLQKVKKHREETGGATTLIPASAPPDSSALKANLAKARELAAKVQRGKQTGEDRSQQQDAETRDR